MQNANTLKLNIERRLVVVPKGIGKYHAFPTMARYGEDLYIAYRSGDTADSTHGVHGVVKLIRTSAADPLGRISEVNLFGDGGNELDAILSGPFDGRMLLTTRDHGAEKWGVYLSNFEATKLKDFKKLRTLSRVSLDKEIGMQMGCFGHVRRSRSGELLMSGLGVMDKTRKSHSPILFSSNDLGRTWRVKAVLAYSEEEGKVLTEFSVVNTGGAKWLALIRNETPPYAVLASVSKDDGANWSPLFESGLLGHAPMLFGEGENPKFLLVVYRDLENEPPGVAVGASLDQGRSWRRVGRLAEYSGHVYDGGYGDLVRLDDGRFLAVYYTCDEDNSPWIEGTIFSILATGEGEIS